MTPGRVVGMVTRELLISSVLRSQDARPEGAALSWSDAEAIADRLVADGLVAVDPEFTGPPDPYVPGAASAASVRAMADSHERYLRTVEEMAPDPVLQARIDRERRPR
jgi:hypothetical protein